MLPAGQRAIPFEPWKSIDADLSTVDPIEVDSVSAIALHRAGTHIHGYGVLFYDFEKGRGIVIDRPYNVAPRHNMYTGIVINNEQCRLTIPRLTGVHFTGNVIMDTQGLKVNVIALEPDIQPDDGQLIYIDNIILFSFFDYPDITQMRTVDLGGRIIKTCGYLHTNVSHGQAFLFNNNLIIKLVGIHETDTPRTAGAFVQVIGYVLYEPNFGLAIHVHQLNQAKAKEDDKYDGEEDYPEIKNLRYSPMDVYCDKRNF